jgi:hypothetical protein
LATVPPASPASPPSTTPTARERLAALFAKVDAFFDGAAARFPGADGITCHAGCADCCRRFSMTAVEGEIVSAGLASLPAATRGAIAQRARHGNPDTCPALEADGRCAVYAFRPVICRTHGLPIRFAAEPVLAAGHRQLPVVDACPRNFGGRDLTSLPGDAVLDQTVVSTVLGAIDAARADEAGRPRGERVSIEALVACNPSHTIQ